jgi:hypothetical protein
VIWRPSVKVAVVLAAVAWTAIHLRAYAPATMLWFCAYGNLAIAIGIALESRLLLSIEAVALLLPQTVWMLDAGWRLVTGARGGGTSYLFDPRLPLAVRLLSLFHVIVPVLLVYALARLGYDRRAFRLQWAIGTVVLLASFGAGSLNVNGVYAPLAGPLARQPSLPPLVHLLAALVLWPVLGWLPTHLLLSRGEDGWRTTVFPDGTVAELSIGARLDVRELYDSAAEPSA